MPKPILTNLGELLINILGIEFFHNNQKKSKPNMTKDKTIPVNLTK